jgi:hypothetical protein
MLMRAIFYGVSAIVFFIYRTVRYAVYDIRDILRWKIRSYILPIFCIHSTHSLAVLPR